MKIKTSELTGAALDWAAFVASGMSYWTRSNADWSSDWTDWVLDSDKQLKKFWFDGAASRAGHWREHEVWKPSADWAQGGPIIDLEDITVGPWDTSPAFAQPKGWPESGPRQVGPTKLIAAMRCFVASKLGDEVDVPEELLK